MVLSGPFREKDSASDSIADSSDAFVVPSEAIGEHNASHGTVCLSEYS